jgi:hypothetical protein
MNSGGGGPEVACGEPGWRKLLMAVVWCSLRVMTEGDTTSIGQILHDNGIVG